MRYSVQSNHALYEFHETYFVFNRNSDLDITIQLFEALKENLVIKDMGIHGRKIGKLQDHT